MHRGTKARLPWRYVCLPRRGRIRILSRTVSIPGDARRPAGIETPAGGRCSVAEAAIAPAAAHPAAHGDGNGSSRSSRCPIKLIYTRFPAQSQSVIYTESIRGGRSVRPAGEARRPDRHLWQVGKADYLMHAMPRRNASIFKGMNFAFAPANISSIMVSMVSGLSTLVAAT